ncbi:MAG: hypothetical protein ACLTQI_08765 [Slackia sp.]
MLVERLILSLRLPPRVVKIGNDTHPGTTRALSAHGVSFSPRAAVQLNAADYDAYDLFVGMDSANIRNMRRCSTEILRAKCTSFSNSEGVATDDASDVADPWYTGDFETTYSDVLRGCEALLAFLSKAVESPLGPSVLFCDLADVSHSLPNQPVWRRLRSSPRKRVLILIAVRRIASMLPSAVLVWLRKTRADTSPRI